MNIIQISRDNGDSWQEPTEQELRDFCAYIERLGGTYSTPYVTFKVIASQDAGADEDDSIG